MAICRKSGADGETVKRQRRKPKPTTNSNEGVESGSSSAADDDDDVKETEEETRNLTIDEVNEASHEPITTFDDGVFTVTISGPQQQAATSSMGDGCVRSGRDGMRSDCFVPCPRMNPLLAVKHGVLFLFGGTFERGDRQFTLADFYSLDVRQLDEWKTLVPLDVETQVC